MKNTQEKTLANELRIEDWVRMTTECRNAHSEESEVDGDIKVAEIQRDNFQCYNEEEVIYLTDGKKECEPIPLTEDWLKRFGFERIGSCFEKGDFVINILVNPVEYFYGKVKLDHVHVLQNIYYWHNDRQELKLTGE